VTNPSRSDPAVYRENLLRLLGERDALEVARQTASTLAGIVREHEAAVLRTRPFEGKWTPNEVMGHLTDGEWVYGYRLRLVLCEDAPSIQRTSQDRWVAGLGHNDREPQEHVESFRALRSLNLELWRRLSAGDLERTGVHNERGPESLATMLRMMAGHDLSHLEQIARLIQAVRSAPLSRGGGARCRG
jgi:hypothetical protein